MDSYSQAQKQIKHTILTRRSPRHMPIMPTKYSKAPTIWDFWALRNPLKNWNWKQADCQNQGIYTGIGQRI
jgi:hypothetical protein